MTEKTLKIKTAEKSEKEENVIYVGKKPPMSYVLAVVTQFNSNGSDTVILKARGRAISHAVDVVEIVRRKFLQDVKIKSIDIGTQQLPAREGEEGRGPVNVSTIEITLTR